MKAVILAAGKGTRLASVTATMPKSLIQVKGKSILEHIVELCRRHGISELFVNTHHFAEKIVSTLGDGSRFGLNITYSYETELLGTAGAVKNFEVHLSHGPFFVLYGDNYSEYDLNLLIQKSNLHKALGTIAFHYRDDVSSSGVGEFGADGRILRFLEKPKPGDSLSHWVNAGIYYFLPGILERIPNGNSDFAKDIFPRLLGSGIPLYGVCANSDVLAFDTPEMYENSLRKLH